MSRTLLLASGSPAVRRVFELAFTPAEMRIAAVGDGREAIERIASDPPGIVFAEVSLAERDGYEVAEFVRGSADLASIPVVLLAGVSDTVDEPRAQRLDCGVLLKPLNPQTVVTRVRALWPDPFAAATLGGDSAASTPMPEPTAPSQASPAPDAGDYLDRLDAAFAALSAPPNPLAEPRGAAPVSAVAARNDPTASPDLTTIDRIVRAPVAEGRTASADGSHEFLPRLTSTPERDAQLAAPPVSEPRKAPAADEPSVPAIPDGVIDEIARRVIARLGDEQMRRAVLDAAERLVREEIDRIKALARQTSGPS